MEITEQMLDTLPFQSVRKMAVIYARPLTGEDYIQMGGRVKTLEGKVAFQVGDFLARGVQNEEWPIPHDYFYAHYQRLYEPDATGFACYQSATIRQACQIPEAFTVHGANETVFTGQAGDYLLRSKDCIWIVQRTIFEVSYEHLASTGEQEDSPTN